MSALRRASITQLCAADHDNDPQAIAAWVGDRDADAFRALMQETDKQFLIAEINGQMAGLGGVAGAMITLNYVHPDFRFQGVSKAMLAALEGVIAAQGFAHATLVSTTTALGFYQALGWVRTGGGNKEVGYPLNKPLA